MQVHPESLDLLASRLTALELRVAALEHPSTTAAAAPDEVLHPVESAESSPQIGPDSGSPTTATTTTLTGAFSLFGAALLGIAGAYLLRAVYGANLLPRALVAGLAVIYATSWLLAAARYTSRRIAASLFAATSVMILAPMLWEMSIRFQAMSAATAASYLAAYAAIATALSWRSTLRSVGATAFSVAISGSALIAVALSIATHSMALFTVILLALYSVCELSSLRDHVGSVRILIALCTDSSIWVLLYVYSLPLNEQTGYAPLNSVVILSSVVLLFAIQIVSIVIHAVRRAQPIEVFAVLQALISFAMLIFGMVWFVPACGRQAIGALCLLLAVSSYYAAYGPIRRGAGRRNFSIFIVWSCVLLPAAAFLLTPSAIASAILATVAAAAVPLAARTQARSIEIQGAIFLGIAAYASGLLSYTANTLAGKMPGYPAWSVLLVAVLTALVYAMAKETPGESAVVQAIHLLLAFLAACSLAAFLARGLVGLTSFALKPETFHIASLRTGALCATALALAWLGVRYGRAQMIRLAYTALAFAVAKLLFEDLRHGRMEFIAISIFLVALTFITIPRVTKTHLHAGPLAGPFQ